MLQALQTGAEEAIKSYVFDEDLTLKKLNYTNVNKIDEAIMQTLEYSDHFRQEVNLNMSGVQIPIEIYEGCKYVN